MDTRFLVLNTLGSLTLEMKNLDIWTVEEALNSCFGSNVQMAYTKP